MVARGVPAWVTMEVVVVGVDRRVRELNTQRDADTFSVELPPDAVELFGVRFALDPTAAQGIEHHIGEAGTGVDAGGQVVLASVTNGAGNELAVARIAAVGVDANVVDAVDGGRLIDFELTGNSAFVRVAQPNDGTPLAVVTDPATASLAVDGELAFRTGSGQVIAARVVTTRASVPGSGTRFIAASTGPLRALLDGYAPGTGAVDQIWLDGVAAPLDDAALQSPALRDLVVTERVNVARLLRSDGQIRGARRLLGFSALASVVLALVAGALLIIAERHDARAEFELLESQGCTPARLRRLLLVRGAGVLCVAVPAAAAVAGGLAWSIRRTVGVLGPAGVTGGAPLDGAMSTRGLWWLVAVVGAFVGSMVAVSAGSFREERA